MKQTIESKYNVGDSVVAAYGSFLMVAGYKKTTVTKVRYSEKRSGFECQVEGLNGWVDESALYPSTDGE